MSVCYKKIKAPSILLIEDLIATIVRLVIRERENLTYIPKIKENKNVK